jgi:pyruvate dehydrogenase E2 component (dihydrolipoamide acetyltransferase)
MSLIDVKVPDIGDFKNIPVIEIAVKPGDEVKADDPLVTLESDKATLDVPAPQGGRIAEVLVKIGDKVSMGSAIVKLEQSGGGAAEAKPAPAPASGGSGKPAKSAQDPQTNASLSEPIVAKQAAGEELPPAAGRSGLPPPVDFGNAHASPSVRRIARELDVDLTKIKGSGDKGRITVEDVKRALGGGAGSSGTGSGIPEIPAQDFSKFGPIEEKKLSRLQKLSGPHLQRAWLNIPHVTHTDEADITELDAYRKQLDTAGKEKGYRVTLLSFLLKASVAALKENPEFNASLSPGKDALILKKYYNVGVAVDTPDGLVVPVIKEVDRKGIIELSQELGTVSARMREGKIQPNDISGGTFSISSLGGIGGTNFTPIVNAPEVAILGVVRSTIKPVWDGKAFQPRLMLPLCLSYDHRVIDGASAARFTKRLADILSDVRELVL